MKKLFEHIVLEYSDDNLFLDQLFTTLYFYSRNIYEVNNNLIKSYLLPKSNELVSELLSQMDSELSTKKLIELFEIAIPKNEQQTNGAIYTPSFIKKYIIDNTFNRFSEKLHSILIADISCGCGAFLYSAAKKLKLKTGKQYKEIFSQLYGLDISENSVQRAKILLSILAITEGEDQNSYEFNIFQGNSLDYNWFKVEKIYENNGFDLVIGNPPYVRAKNLDPKSKELIKSLKVGSSGNIDLYIPFFEIGINILNENGILGYITVNSFFKSVNARGLRNYLSEKRYSLDIINFGDEQIFANRLTYTCLFFVDKAIVGNVSYARATSNDIKNKEYIYFSILQYDDLNHHRGWLLSNSVTVSNINKIENTGSTLDELYTIKNGIATLSNDIFIFKPIREDDDYYYFFKDKVERQVEKLICKDIIKPNILKSENDIDPAMEKIIFPYLKAKGILQLLEEDFFNKEYPFAFRYLSDYKIQLNERDKGNGNYKEWFAFGRTQALADSGLKLLFPYMAKRPHFVFTDNVEMLIYCGYAIFSKSKRELLILKKILESDVFDYYIRNTSKPYSSNYYSYAKNYVKHFGVCELSFSEEDELLSLDCTEKINAFILNKYQITM
ncbi:HsdM family class I SAM-dependent methyltransferase [Psychrobacter sp. K31L]|uniref:HsdM family class I SAM-dependent methyltransferase n=1 Tax=Psychrobacter sp. K31L TaxID=2820758 RepID=UPI001B339038|nr:N-6 DNA methylase [Psychrobacter sp. K31L]MBP3947009.1 N-6 DNA methylase [Psychrobacter sp. K31L]